MAKTPPTPTPPNPNPPSTKDFENNSAALKLTEQLLANVERRTQKLLILQKAIEFKIIDPKDVRNYEKFINELANADLSNLSEMKNIGKYLGAGAKRVNDLVDYTSHLVRNNDKYSEGLLAQNREYAEINHRIEKQLKSTQKLNSENKKANNLVDEFVESYKDANDEIFNVVDIQKKVLSGLRKIRKSQDANAVSAELFSGTYDDFSSNLADKIKDLGSATSKISPTIEFGALDIKQQKYRQDLQKIISSAGQETVEINGIEISSANKKDIFDAIVNSSKNASIEAEKVLQGTTNALGTEISKVFKKKFKINVSADDAISLTQDFVEEQARMISGMPSLLSDSRKKEIQDFYEKVQKSGDAGLQSLLASAAKSSIEIKLINADIEKMSEQIKAIPKLDSVFGGLKRGLDEITTTLKYSVDGLMPRWLSSAIQLDDRFSKVQESLTEGLEKAAENIANGASKTEALAGFAGQFSSSIFKALGPIGLIVIAVTSLYSLFQTMSESAKQFRNELGVSRDTAKSLYKQTLDITTASDNLYIKQEDVLSVLKKHNEEYGMILDLSNKANQESIKFSTALAKQYGMAAGEMYGFTQQLQTLGADQETSEQLTAWVAKTSELAGIPFGNITKDLAESSEFIAMHFVNMPEQAVKTTMKLRAMGSSLKQVEKAMEKAFDFESFLKGMTELNIMTQGVVDLSKYFDLATSLAPLDDQAKELNAQFDKMVASGQANYFTMKQFSDLTGQSSEELLRGNKIRTKGAKLSEKELDLLIKYQDKLSEADLADAKSLAMAADKLSANEKLDATWQSIKDTLVQSLLPALEAFSAILGSIAPALKLIGALLKGLAVPLAIISDIFTLITGGFEGMKTNGSATLKMFEGWNSALGLVSVALTTIIGALATIWSYKKIAGMFSGFGDALKGGGKTSGGLGEMFKGLFSKSKTSTGKTGGGLGQMFKGLFSKSKTIDGKTIGQLTGKKSIFSTTLDKFRKLFTGKKSIFTTIFDKAKGLVGMSGDSPLDSASDALLAAAENLNAAADSFSSCCMTGEITDAISNMPGSNGVDIPADTPDQQNRRDRNRRGGRSTRGPIRQNRPNRIPSPTPSPAPRGRLGKIGQFFGKGWDWMKNLIPKSAPSATSGASTMGKLGSFFAKNSKVLAKGGGALAVLSAGMDFKDRKDQGQTTTQAAIGSTSGALGGLGGAAAGAKAGAVIGSFFGPGIGTAIGAALGGIAGGIGGWWAASKTADKLTGVGEKTGEEISSAAVDSVLKGLSEPEIQRLKDAGVSDSVIEGLNTGELTIEDAIKKEFGDVKLSDEQMKIIMDPNSSGVDVQNAINSAMGLEAYSKKDVSQDLSQIATPSETPKVEDISQIATPSETPKVEDISQIATPKTDAVSANSFLGFTPQYVDVNDIKPETISYEPETLLPKQFNILPPSPAQQSLEDVGIVGEREIVSSTTNYVSTESNGSANSSTAAIKQMSNVLEMYANRPVIVQIGGTELKSFNKSLKVYNNA